MFIGKIAGGGTQHRKLIGRREFILKGTASPDGFGF
jgi:hypothetical protein